MHDDSPQARSIERVTLIERVGFDSVDLAPHALLSQSGSLTMGRVLLLMESTKMRSHGSEF
jgi:hypothetical protein